MSKELVWNVYRYNMNTKKIEPWNVFGHWKFLQDLYKLKVKYLKKDDFRFEEFVEEVKKDLMYYYWSKCEWEVVITEVAPHISEKELERIMTEKDLFYKRQVNLNVEEKIDVYDQVMVNWESFKEYLFNNYKLIKKVK